MAEKSRFWNSTTEDPREYQAAEFAEYFSRFLSDGIYVGSNQADLKVTTGAGLSVNIAPGFAFIRGYLYKNDSTLNKSVDSAHGTLDRIDRVVIKFDEVGRKIEAYIKKGEIGSSPQPPELVVDDTIKEISLAQLRINHGATTVLVTDERLTSYCGVVSLIIDVPLDDLLAEWEQFKDDKTTDYQTWLSWLEGLLDETTAGNLLNLIDEHMGDDGNPHEVTKSQVGLTAVDDIKQMPIAGGTFTGAVKAQTNTNYTTAQLRNVILSPNDASSSSMNNGDIWIKYS